MLGSASRMHQERFNIDSNQSASCVGAAYRISRDIVLLLVQRVLLG
jgi:hypothetical protein